MASRFACLLVPRFVVAALLRAEPELRGAPLVVCDAGSRAMVLDVSPEAHRAGARPGLTVAQALIRHADLVVRPLDADALVAARVALTEVGRSVSPLVEEVGAVDGYAARAEPGEHAGGEIVVDIAGLERLFGSPAGIAAALSRRAERVGLSAGVGIADRRATARIAAGVALRRREAILVEAGGDASWLAPLPLALLGRACEADGYTRGRHGWTAVVESLARLGVTRCHELAAMPVDEVASRLGKVATQLWYVAAGRDRSPLRPCVVPHEHVEGTRLEYGVSSLEALLFVVRGLLDRVLARLAMSSLACSGLTLALSLEDGSRIERAVGVLAPTRDVKTLTLLVRSALEAAPPHAAVEAVQVVALPDRPRADQLDLFRPAGPPPERLATTLARLAALCGTDRVGRAVPPAGHRPDAFRLVPFQSPCSMATRAAAAEDPSDLPLVGSCATLALRALRPPRVAQVFVEAGRIAYVRAAGLGGRAVVTSGPWRIDVEWWSASPCRRDYYDVQLSDGGVYRLYRDLDALRPDTSWYVDGCYD